MALSQLTSLGSYGEINSGAHRKAALIVGIPSLVRHLGIWDTGVPAPAQGATAVEGAAEVASVHEPGTAANPPADAEMSEDATEAPRPAAYRRYVADLKKIIESGKTGNLERDPDDFVSKLGRPIDTGTVTHVQFWWYGMRATIRLEFHTEYVTVTSIIDVSIKTHPNDRAAVDGDLLSEIEKKFARLKKLFESCPKDQQADYASLSQYLQIDLWRAFEEEVLDARRQDGTRILDRALGEVFLDSRGVVIGSRKVEPEAHEQCEDLTVDQVLLEPFQHEIPRRTEIPRRRARHSIEHRFPGDKWARETLQRIWPFVEAEPPFGEYEFTVTGFLQGRVLFVTALGPQPTEDEAKGTKDQTDEGGSKGGEGRPIRYFLHAYTDDEWQLGRLVDRINTLGTLRLAATMEIGSLKKAGDLMDKLAREIGVTGDTIQKAIKHVEGRASNRSSQKIVTIEQAEKEMEEVGNIYKSISEEVSDISGRLERSHYYIDRFNTESADLRERRVEGFQTYTEFVKRRMSTIFGYVGFLRTRMEIIESQNSNLARHYSSLKIADVTGGINRLVESMTKQDEEIEKIQYVGELALITVLIPYYLGTVLFEHIHRPSEANRIWAWAALLVAFVLVGMWRASAPLRKSRRRKRVARRNGAEERNGAAASTENEGVTEAAKAPAWLALYGLLAYFLIVVAFSILAPMLIGSGEAGADDSGHGSIRHDAGNVVGSPR